MTLTPTLYKIVTETLWRDARQSGVFRGAAIDLKDGFIHFSTARQAVQTAALHFAGQAGLLLVAVDGAAFCACVRGSEPAAGVAPPSTAFTLT